MKKIFTTLLVVLLSVLSFSSCSKDEEAVETNPILKVINQTTCKHNVFLESSFLGTVYGGETKEFDLPLIPSGGLQERKTIKAEQNCGDATYLDVTMWEFYRNGQTYQLLID